ncbi:MAG: HAD family hydrolase [Kiritimatiellae bacterium]|nr:HAD family hydrolase [Kiritimatiellia bacterium]
MYVIWDWNGTLLDDTSAALNALNVILTRRNLRPLSLAEYRETFAFPTVKFYESLGIELNDDISREFHEAYYSFPAKLNSEANAAVKYLAEKGIGQSILSALRQDHLEKDVRHYFGDSPQNQKGDCPHFDHIVGSDNLDGGTKFERGQSLLKTLKSEGLSPEDIVMVGDAIHDKEVADALGVKCLLVSVGGHAHHRLAAIAQAHSSLLSAVHSLCLA